MSAQFNNKFTKASMLVSCIVLVAVFLIISDAKNSNENDYANFIKNEYARFHNSTTTDEQSGYTGLHHAAFQNYIQTLDPATQRVPQERLYDAWTQTKSMHNAGSALKTSDDPVIWHEYPSNTGGRARAIMWDPNDSGQKKVWAGAVTGGLWYNNDIPDSNSNWIPVNDFWDNLVISCIVHDPLNPEIFYVGTGEGQTAITIYRESSGRGVGIWKSTDAGTTWELIPSTSTFAYVNDIIIREEGGTSVIYAGVVSGFYKGEFYHADPTEGVYRSEDGGQSWDQVLPKVSVVSKTYAPADLELTSSGRIFVGTQRNIDGDGGATILYSDNGYDWTVYSEFRTMIENDVSHPTGDLYFNVPGRAMLASAPSDPNRVYVLMGSGVPAYFTFARCFYIARTDDAGASWNLINIPDAQGNPNADRNWAYISWHALLSKVDPTDPDILYAGGLDLYRTKNAGSTWEWISDTEGFFQAVDDDTTYVHGDLHHLSFKPGSRDEMIICTDGGIFYSNNLSDDVPFYREANNDFNTIQYYTCAIHPDAGETYYMAGTQDNSTFIYQHDTLTADDRRLGGDGAYCFIDEENPDIQIASIQFNLYAISTDGMETILDYEEDYGTGIFINPAAYDSHDKILYANAMTAWGGYQDELLVIENITGTPTSKYLSGNTGAITPYSSVCLSPFRDDGPVLFIGTQSGDLFKMRHPNTSPITTRLDKGIMPDANISCISQGHRYEELLVTYSNYGVASVWYTDNGSLTWKNIEGNLPDIPVRWGIIHPENHLKAMLATELGIWVTADIKAENVVWEPALDGLANIRVDMLRVRKSDNMVIAATHGRGLYFTTWDVEPEAINDLEAEVVQIFPNPASEVVSCQLPANSKFTDLAVCDNTGKQVYNASTFANQIRFDCSNWIPGIYFVTLSGSSGSVSKKLVVR